MSIKKENLHGGVGSTPLPPLEEGAGGRRPKVAIIKYNAGNTQSVLFALERIGVEAIVTDDAKTIKEADKVIFPGVGEASTAMRYLRERELDKVIISLKQPVLGICLGMQLLCNRSEENDTEGLGIFNTSVIKFSHKLKIPHTGWNKVIYKTGEQYYYFVHGYYAEVCPDTTGVTDYGVLFSSMLQKENFFGVQYHPEKSSLAGELILKNFISL